MIEESQKVCCDYNVERFSVPAFLRVDY